MHCPSHVFASIILVIFTWLFRALLFPVYLWQGTGFGPCVSYLRLCDSHHLGSLRRARSFELPL